MAVDKINGFRAPYTSATFRSIVDSQTGRNGLLEMDGVVTHSSSFVSVPPFKVVQQGLIYSKSISTLVPTPTLAPPYYVVVTAPTPGKLDDLIFSYAKGPADLTETSVALASYDGFEWQTAPIISIDGVIKDRYLENVVTGRVGPYTGLKTSVDGSDYRTTSGTLIDKTGQKQVFAEDALNPIISPDPDWKRVDRIVYRRPSDSDKRIGYRKFLLGGTYAASPAAKDVMPLFLTASSYRSTKALITSDNAAHVFCSYDTGYGFDISYTKLSSDRSVEIFSESLLITGAGDANFDAIVTDDDYIHLVYSSSGNIYYQKIDSSTGSLEGSALIVDTQTGYCKNPKVSLDASSSRIYIVYQSLVGVLSQIYFTVRDATTGVQAVPPVRLTDPVTVVNNLENPDIWVDEDYQVHVVWENTANTSVHYQVFDDIGTSQEVAIAVNSSVTYGAGTLSTGASHPRVVVSDNFDVFVAFLQDKGVGTGVAIWDGTSATMQDFFTATEDFSGFDIHVEPIFNGVSLLLSRVDVNSVDIVKLHEGSVAFTVSLDSAETYGRSLVRDNLGSFYASWTTSIDCSGGKSPAQSADLAYSYTELDGDIILARMLQDPAMSGPVVLNWATGGRPGSFFDFLTAYGASVTIGWEEVTPNTLTLGVGPGSTDLKVIDLFTDTSYTVASGSYTILDGEALFVRLDGSSTTVVPESLPIALLPWEEDIGVLGMSKDGEFNPILLGLAGMEQLDSGESIIFGEDLPQSIRARLGIINETSYQQYSSTIAQNYSDTYPQALSNIDIMAGQNTHVRLVGFVGDWNVVAPNTLRILQNCYLQIPGLHDVRNTIAPQNIALADGQIAYVDLNRVNGSSTILPVSVAASSSVPLTRNKYMLARRIGNKVEVDGQAITYEDALITGQTNNIVQEGDTFERAIKRLDIREDVVKRVTVITRTHTSLPTGATCEIDSITLVDGDKVLFANSLLNGIYKISGVGSTISWQKLYEFAGSQTPTTKSCVLVTNGGHVNRTLWSYDDVKGWYRLSTLEDFVGVRAADLTTTTLPSGAGPLVVDGVTINEGEIVLFGNAALNKVYRVTGLGTAMSFEPLNVFKGSEVPSDGSLVLVEDGSVSDMMWEYDEELPGWIYLSITPENKVFLGLDSPSKSGGAYQDQLVAGQLNNVVEEGDPLEKAIKRLDIRSDVLKRARAVSTTASVLPTTAPLVVDGVTIVTGDVVLFAHAALDGLYQATVTGGSITWVKQFAFAGDTTGSKQSLVYVYEGALTNMAFWARDPAKTVPWYKLIDPALIQQLFDIVAIHTDEINDLQNSIAAILANRPDFEIFTAGAGGQAVFNLTRFSVNPDNTVLDVYVMWNGRWQSLSRAGDFSDGQFRKNSATQIEMAEVIPEGEEIEVFIWDPAALLVRTAKEQKFIAGVGGQSVFTLDPLVFTLEPDNTIIDAEYFYQGRWQHQSLLGDFTDGSVRKNSVIEIETSEPIPEGGELVVVRRVPVGGSGGGGGGSTDLTNISTDLGFILPGLSVGTLTKPAGSMILADTVTTDIWEIKVESGTLKVVKIN